MTGSFVFLIVDLKFTNYKQTRNILSKIRKMSIGNWKEKKICAKMRKMHFLTNK